MTRDPSSSRHARIDAADVEWIEVTDGGRRLCLRLRDVAGRPAALSLPSDCLNRVLSSLPASAGQPAAEGGADIHRLDGWSLDRRAGSLVLTLHRADGARIAFAVTPWQIAAIASLAGQDAPRQGRRLN